MPPCITFAAITQPAAPRARGEDVIDLGMGDPDAPPPHVVENLTETLKNLRVHGLLDVAGHRRAAPGLGFGEYGRFVRIALVENRARLRQAVRNVKRFMA